MMERTKPHDLVHHQLLRQILEVVYHLFGKLESNGLAVSVVDGCKVLLIQVFVLS